MNYTTIRCPNLNHSRSKGPIKFCPNCGELMNSSASGRCDETKHAVRRKDRDTFCVDCGKKIGS